jgi:predicted dehydrogenase
MRNRLGIAVVGFGWMGQAHSRSFLRIPTLFEERSTDPVLVVCADSVPARREQALGAFGFAAAVAEWRHAVERPDVDAVVVTAPNMLHLEVIEAACEAGKHVFCEKPVGGTPELTAQAAAAAREAGVVSGVGYNYRFAPLVRHARTLIAEGRIGPVSTYRGRFFSMYGSNPLGLLSWRFQQEDAGYGASSDLLSHAIDLAHALVGPIRRVVGTRATTISERPLPVPGEGTHYGRGRPADPTGAVTNEDYAAMLVEFEIPAVGTFESSRVLVGPESEMAFDVYGSHGALAWNLERLNELRLYRASDDAETGYTTVLGGERFPLHGAFAPGSGIGIGFEDLIAIEDFEFLEAIARGEPHEPGFEEALRVAQVQQALVRSWASGRWEHVGALVGAPA